MSVFNRIVKMLFSKSNDKIEDSIYQEKSGDVVGVFTVIDNKIISDKVVLIIDHTYKNRYFNYEKIYGQGNISGETSGTGDIFENLKRRFKSEFTSSTCTLLGRTTLTTVFREIEVTKNMFFTKEDAVNYLNEKILKDIS